VIGATVAEGIFPDVLPEIVALQSLRALRACGDETQR
jgi:hypothetical protein